MADAKAKKYFLETLLFLFFPFSTASYWSYDDVNDWNKQFPLCGGDATSNNRQSPIELRKDTSYSRSPEPIRFHNYEAFLVDNITLTNNGHTVQFQIPPLQSGNGFPSITNKLLKDLYIPSNVHFHWGSPNTKGSEHVIEGQRYDAEMHIVHRNVKYPTTEEAAKHKNGLTVLGVLFNISHAPAFYYPCLEQIFDQLPEVQAYKSQTKLRRHITMRQLLGNLEFTHFYTYMGTLTTPPCSEAVTWYVYPEPLSIEGRKIGKFWNIRDGHHNPLVNNWRPLQKLFNRIILYRSN